MTPFELLAIVAVIARRARHTLSLRPVVAGSSGRSTGIAREFLDPFIVAGLAAWVLITFVARTYYIPSGSMLPTLQIHDVLLVDKFEYRFHPPNEGDIVVFPPPVPTPDDFIKRVIGRPGDTLRIYGRHRLHQRPPLTRAVHGRTAVVQSRNPRLRYLRELRRRLAAHRSSDNANVPPQRRNGPRRTAFRRTATSCSATIATIPKIRTSGASRKTADASQPASARRHGGGLYRPRVPDFLAALAGQDSLAAGAK